MVTGLKQTHHRICRAGSDHEATGSDREECLMDNTAAIFEMFGGQSIYDSFPTDEFPEDVQGWRSTHHVFEKTIDALHPSVIAEVGVWKGGSSIHMAKICRSLGLNTKVLSIDTFLGSVEHEMKK